MSVFDINLDAVEESKDFSPVKQGQYRLRVEEIEDKVDDKGRNVISIRHALVEPEGVDTVGEGIAGGIFNTLYLHTKKAFPFLRRFIESHGVTWEDFKANRDLQRFVGLEAEAFVTLRTKDQDGNDLDPRNQIKRYIVAKVNTQ